MLFQSGDLALEVAEVRLTEIFGIDQTYLGEVFLTIRINTVSKKYGVAGGAVARRYFLGPPKWATGFITPATKITLTPSPGLKSPFSLTGPGPKLEFY